MIDRLNRRTFNKALLGSGAALLLRPALAAATSPAGEIGARLDAVVRAFVEAEQFTGAVLVTRGEETLLRAGYGIANRITDEPNTPETAYQIASLTKAFTALALVQLDVAGELSLDDPITRYLPEVIHGERDGIAVTIRQLLAHTSGVPDFIGFYEVENPFTYPLTFEQLLDDIIAHELEFTPGTQFAYSNSGYTYAGLIIERVSGQTYAQYLREHIFDPARLHDTFLIEPPDPAPPIAKGYGLSNGQYVAFSDFGRPEMIAAAGGLTSTVDDLLRWHEVLQTDLLAPRSAITAMYEPVTDGYGLGWELVNIAGHRSVGHTGHTIGYDAQFSRFLDEGVVIVVLSNFQGAPVTDLRAQLAQTVFSA